MNISRKEFFRQGALSIGDTVFKAAGALKGARDSLLSSIPREAAPEAAPDPGLPMYAVALNERCLAGNCGCFACVERCELQAITLQAGEGIRIDEQLCTGCGNCEYVCPVTPRAILLKPRKMELQHQKGERSC